MITGRIEEPWKAFCQKHRCTYYLHRDYPQCSYCAYPNNCPFIDKQTDKNKSEDKMEVDE